MNLNTSRWIVAGAILLGVSFVVINSDWKSLEDESSAENFAVVGASGNAGRLDENEAHTAFFDFDGITVWDDTFIRQSFTAENFSRVMVLDEHLRPAPGDPYKVVHSAVANFTLFCVASAGLDQFCVAGFGRGGDFILERWELVPATSASRSGPFAEPLVTTQVGDILSKDFQKTRIYKGSLGESVISIGFDPDRRFMLALIDDDQGGSTIYRFDNVPSAVPTSLYDSNAYPELAALGHFNRFNHIATAIRVWTLTSRAEFGDLRMMMIDVDNDGVFDGAPLIGDEDYFENAGYPMVFPYWDSLDGTGY